MDFLQSKEQILFLGFLFLDTENRAFLMLWEVIVIMKQTCGESWRKVGNFLKKFCRVALLQISSKVQRNLSYFWKDVGKLKSFMNDNSQKWFSNSNILIYNMKSTFSFYVNLWKLPPTIPKKSISMSGNDLRKHPIFQHLMFNFT